jgi:hypothetical protein
MTISHFITVHFITLDWWSFILAQVPISRKTGCAVKGGGPQREINPPGNWFAPPGSNRSSGGGNEAAEAFGVEGRIGDSASKQAVT